MRAEIECEICCNIMSVEIDDSEEDSEEIECSICGALLEYVYSSGEIDEVYVVENPSAAFKCPKCRCSMEIQIEDESGFEEVECEGCGVQLGITWSDWGESVVVEVLEEEEDDEDSEEDEDSGEDFEDEEDFDEDFEDDDDFDEDEDFD